MSIQCGWLRRSYWTAIVIHIIGSDEHIAMLSSTVIITLIYAGENEEYIPYIQPYDILEFLPTMRSKISIHAEGIEKLKVKEGTILQTCSGRNLGPLVIADKYLEQFIFGSDLIRIDVNDEVLRNYIYAFFSSWIGQALLHSNKTGSVIDHLSKNDIREIKIPLCSDKDIANISEIVKNYIKYYSEARMKIKCLIDQFIDLTNAERVERRLSSGWSVDLCDMVSYMRLDSAFYDPKVQKEACILKKNGGVELRRVARVLKPSGRYKMDYVEKGHGRPLVSGRQLLQNEIVNMKYIPYKNEEGFKKFQLEEGQIAYPADGRVEGRLGTPVYVTQKRDGWYASGHVGRVLPQKGISPGYLFLALSHPSVRSQFLSLACGSVVDAIYPDDMGGIIVPPMIDFPYEDVIKAWELFDFAENEKDKFCNCIERMLLEEIDIKK